MRKRGYQGVRRLGGLLVFLGPVWVLLMNGCSGADPRIQQMYWELEFQREPYQRLPEGGFAERGNPRTVENLSVYIQPQDSDGFDDITVLYVIHDKAELYWEAGPDEWVSYEEEGAQWIGLTQIRRADPEPGWGLPRGRYRAEVRDRGGNTARTAFTLTQGRETSPEEIPFPRLIPVPSASAGSAGGEIYQLELVGDEGSLWIYSRGEELVSRKAFTQPGTYSKKELFAQPSQSSRGYYALLYQGDPDREAGLIWGPVPLETQE